MLYNNIYKIYISVINYFRKLVASILYHNTISYCSMTILLPLQKKKKRIGTVIF